MNPDRGTSWPPRESSRPTRYSCEGKVGTSAGGFVKFWYGSGSMPLTNVSGSDPAIFVLDLQEANKYFLFCSLLFEGTFNHFSKIESHKTVGIKVFLTIIA
jgi:hypothetical protein